MGVDPPSQPQFSFKFLGSWEEIVRRHPGARVHIDPIIKAVVYIIDRTEHGANGLNEFTGTLSTSKTALGNTILPVLPTSTLIFDQSSTSLRVSPTARLNKRDGQQQKRLPFH